MKNLTKILILTILLAFGFQMGSAFAKDWVLPGIKIITRTQRGANEALRYTDASYQERHARLDAKSQEDLNRLAETDLDAFFEKKRSAYETSMANDFLITKYASEQTLDEVRYEYLGNYLKWPESIHKDKMKIIIHHTASDYQELLDSGEGSVGEYLQDVYKYHTITKGRGDIGYHFLIDPYGNVYEGRAGGEGVVAAHTAWNNTPSIGVALMGNFEIQQPTQAQLVTLIKLTTAIAKKYKINPTDKVVYFEKSDEPPYLEEKVGFSIAGHKDAGNTACPGSNLYKLLPTIRNQVASKLSRVRTISSTRTTTTTTTTNTNTTASTETIKTDTPKRTVRTVRSSNTDKLAGVYYSNKSSDTFLIPVDFDSVDSCESVDTTLEVISCEMQGNDLKMEIKQKKTASGIKEFDIKVDGKIQRISFRMLRQYDVDKIINVLKNNYIRYDSVTTKSTTTKIKYKKPLTEVKQNLAGNVSVLLYELTTDYDRREVSCDGKCNVEADGKKYTLSSFIVESGNGYLYLTIGENMTRPKNIKVSSTQKDGVVKINNYKRNSYAKIPWNIFRGTISFQKEKVKSLASGIYYEKNAVVNTLPIKDYLKGIGETSEQENLEKIKLMALLAKTYTLFYIDGKNQHPSIPAGAGYDAIDDPRLFQKYIGAGGEDTFIKYQAVLKATENKVLLYDGYVPILPYFSCSAGFTFSGKEKRGWTDTPYIQSRYDFEKCPDFNGHGVGLSGKGAQYLAGEGRTYDQILDYYFPGVKITNI